MAVAATIFAVVAGLCGLGLVVVVCWRDVPRKPRDRPRVPANRWLPRQD